jgi:tRNA threonylcarbamoyl adenosine modification protein YeaZ
MKILALEFSSAQRSVAVAQTVNGTAVASVNEVVDTGSGATPALAMITEVLSGAKLVREQIECLVLGLGPGSYTGIRASLALAQGWQLARGVKLIGVSSVECLASQAQAEGMTGRVTVVIDAQREEFYVATCEMTDRQRSISPLGIETRAEVNKRAQAGEVLIGPEVSRWFPQARDLFPRAATQARLAAGRNDFVRGDQLEPIYLRAAGFVKARPPRIPSPH